MFTYKFKKLVVDDSLVELDAMDILIFLFRLYCNNTNGYSFTTTRTIGWNNMFYSQQKEERLMRDKVELEVDNQSIKIALEEVYILYEYVHENVEFMGAFSTEEKAKEIKDILQEHTNNIYKIQEFELDKLTTEGTDEVLEIISGLKKKCGLEDTND